MTTEELIKALREKPSRDNRALLDEAAERLEKKEAEIEKQDAEIERLKEILNAYALQYGTVRG